MIPQNYNKHSFIHFYCASQVRHTSKQICSDLNKITLTSLIGFSWNLVGTMTSEWTISGKKMNLPVTGIDNRCYVCCLACHVFSVCQTTAVHCFSETLSVVTFTDLLNIIIKFYDGLESNKSEALIWGRR